MSANFVEKEFYLTIVRHGQTTANVLKNIQGHLDTPLTELGIEQAKTLGKYFQSNGPNKFNRIYTSDLGRAQATCDIILSHLNDQYNQFPPNSDDKTFDCDTTIVVRDARLRERRYGDAYEGQPIDRLKSEAFVLGYNEENFTKYTPDGAESMTQVKERVADFCRDTLLKECQHNEEVLLISHWATIKEILKLFQPKADNSIRKEHLLETPNTAFSRFKIRCRSSEILSAPSYADCVKNYRREKTRIGLDVEEQIDESRNQKSKGQDDLFCITTISLHQIPHLTSNQTSVNMRQQVE